MLTSPGDPENTGVLAALLPNSENTEENLGLKPSRNQTNMIFL